VAVSLREPKDQALVGAVITGDGATEVRQVLVEFVEVEAVDVLAAGAAPGGSRRRRRRACR
jgi:hypothetical protein